MRGEGEKQPFVRAPPSPLSDVKVHTEETEIAGREMAYDADYIVQVGRIRDIRAVGKHGQIQVQVAWFYRPEEAMGGRKVNLAFHLPLAVASAENYFDVSHPYSCQQSQIIRSLGLASNLLSVCLLLLKAFHGQKELFKSEHYDWCFASTIESKCRVHSLHTYQVSAAHLPA